MRISKTTLPLLVRYARSGRVVVFDTETTGGSCSDEICQLAAAEYVNGTRVRTMNVYLRPTCEMNPWAEAVHGLSLDFLEENGIDPEDALRQFFDFLGSNVLLVAHNNRFDMSMLRRECAKFNVLFEPENVETCDSLALARFCRPDLKSHALGKLLEPLGVEGVNNHDALDDTLACAGVFFKLIVSKRRSAVAGAPGISRACHGAPYPQTEPHRREARQKPDSDYLDATGISNGPAGRPTPLTSAPNAPLSKR